MPHGPARPPGPTPRCLCGQHAPASSQPAQRGPRLPHGRERHEGRWTAGVTSPGARSASPSSNLCPFPVTCGPRPVCPLGTPTGVTLRGEGSPGVHLSDRGRDGCLVTAGALPRRWGGRGRGEGKRRKGEGGRGESVDRGSRSVLSRQRRLPSLLSRGRISCRGGRGGSSTARRACFQRGRTSVCSSGHPGPREIGISAQTPVHTSLVGGRGACAFESREVVSGRRRWSGGW